MLTMKYNTQAGNYAKRFEYSEIGGLVLPVVRRA
jgi:hypothetical protein